MGIIFHNLRDIPDFFFTVDVNNLWRESGMYNYFKESHILTHKIIDLIIRPEYSRSFFDSSIIDGGLDCNVFANDRHPMNYYKLV